MRQRLASALFIATVLFGLAARASLPSDGARLVQRSDHHATLGRVALSSRSRVTPPLQVATLPPRVQLAPAAAGSFLSEPPAEVGPIAKRADWFDARGPPLSS